MPCNLCGKWNCVCQYSQPKQQQEFTSCFFSREAMKEHSDFHPQPKAEQDKPAIDTTPSQPAIDTTPSQPAIDTTPQPKQEQDEPIAFVTGVYAGRFVVEPTNSAMVLPINIALYTRPQQRKPLTDEQIDAYLESEWTGYSSYHDCFKEIVRWTEAKHGIKE